MFEGHPLTHYDPESSFSLQALLANEALWLLGELASEFSTALDLESLQCILSGRLHRIFDYDQCTLAVWSEPSDPEYLLFEITSASIDQMPQKVPLQEGWPGRVLMEAKPYFLEDLTQISSTIAPPFNAYWGIDPQAGSLMLLPLKIGERTIGSLNFSAKTPGTYSAVWRNLASLLAVQVGGQLNSILACQRTASVLETLRVSEEKFSKAFSSSPDAITISTLADGRYVEVNDSCLRLTGYSREEIIGHTSTELGLWVNLTDRTSLEEILRRQGVAHNREFTFQIKSDEIRVGLVSAELIDFSGERCLLAVIRDITERQAMEQMKDEFTSVVSHELRTPLTSIRGALGLLASGQLGTLSAKGQRMLEVAIANTDRTVRLVNTILDIARIESGEEMMVQGVCNPTDLINHVVEAMQDMAGQAGIVLSVSPTSAQIWADSDRIIQVFTNLVGNAIKFSPQGGMVWLTAEYQADQILFQVKDQGRGIPADKHQTVFDRFQQVDPADARQQRGTGLGLAICRSIIQEHGGQIWVESTVGKGSTFCFTLPVFREKPS